MNRSETIPDDVYEMLIELLADGLAQYMRKSKLKSLVRESLANSRYADPHHTTIEKMITEARARNREASGLSRDEARRQSLQFYESVIASSESTIKEKIEAQTRIDKIIGNEYTGQLTDDAESQAKRIREELERQRQGYAGNNSSDTEDERVTSGETG